MNARGPLRERAGTRSTTTLTTITGHDACSHGVPRALTALVGRGSDVATVVGLTAGHALVTLTGTGGVGKTRVAMEVARRTAMAGTDVYWLDVAPMSDSVMLRSSLLERLGINDMRERSVHDAVADHVGSGAAQFVLDNCEHLLDAVGELVREVLSAGSSVSVVLTSREPLGVLGECVWRVPSLPCGGPATALGTGNPSVELFLQRAADSGTEVGDEPSTIAAIEAICDRLDGIPLAIELAAARCGHLSPIAIRDALSDRFRLLTGGTRTSVARHRTMRMSLDWSYRLLDEREQQALRTSSVLRGRFDLAAGAALVAIVHGVSEESAADAIERLVDKNMVAFDGTAYRVLDTIRAYATELTSSEELVASRDAHAAWFDRWLKTVARLHDKSKVDRRLAACEPDLVAALEWSSRDPELAASLVRSLAGFWYRTCRCDDIERLGLVVVDALQESAGDTWVKTVCSLAYPAVAASLDGFLDDDVLRAARLAEERGLHSAAAVARNALAFRHQTWEHGAAALQAAEASGSAFAIARARAQLCIIGIATATPSDAAAAMASLHGWSTSLETADGQSILISRSYAAFVNGDLRVASDGFAALLALGEPDPTISMTASVGRWMVGLLLRDDEALVCGRVAARAAVERHRAVPEMEVSLRFVSDPKPPVPPVDSLVHPFQALWRGMGALALVATDRPQQAVELLQRQPRVVAAGSFLAVSDGGVLASIAQLDGEADAERRWRDVLDGAQHGGFRLLVVDALEALAACSTREPRVAGRLLGAADSLRAATGYRHRFGFQQRWFDAADALADPASRLEGARAEWRTVAEWAQRRWGDRNRPSFGWASLTPTEWRVSELVGVGLTNPQIADRLLMSRSTVKTHLAHVFDKVGVRSRAELAASLAHHQASS